jgi:hypothetical protein
MSLAASGGMGGMAGAGAAAAGGLTMAHSAQGNAIAQPIQPNAIPEANIPLGSSAPPPPVSAAVLGADLVDKQQQISLKQVKDLSTLPIVAIDLYSTEPTVASFPPKANDPSATGDLRVSVIGKMKDKIALKATPTSYKTFKKWLSKDKGYPDLQADVLSPTMDEIKSFVVIEGPELWLGLRRLEDGPLYLKKMVTQDDSDSPAIAEELSVDVGVSLANGSLDGSVPQGDDYDRVVCKIRLHETKKALTVFPEEILPLILEQAQYHVAKKNSSQGSDTEDVTSYPIALAVPAPYCNDQSVEALLEATENTGVIFQRSVCALAGALTPSVSKDKPNMIHVHLQELLQERQQEFVEAQIKNPDAQFDDKVLLLLAGVTKDTAECTAIQISGQQSDLPYCMWGNFQVFCNVSYRHEDPMSIVDKCIAELFEALDTIAPEANAPLGMLSYGTSAEQKNIHLIWDKVKRGLEDWEDLPHIYTRPDCVATGTAVLGAVSHGRLSTVVQVPGKKPKAQLAIRVQNVAPVAVGVAMNYHGGKQEKWTAVKTVFDFDRRVPAGPYPIELSAAVCTLHREGRISDLSDEDFVKAVKDKESAKYIPEREQAALNLRVQVMQKLTRDGEWIKVGNEMSPLTIVEKDESKTACEAMTLELSLGLSGLVTQGLVGDRYVTRAVIPSCFSIQALHVILICSHFSLFLQRIGCPSHKIGKKFCDSMVLRSGFCDPLFWRIFC